MTDLIPVRREAPEWHCDGYLLYTLKESGKFRNGDPVMVNEDMIRVSGDNADALLARLQAFLSTPSLSETTKDQGQQDIEKRARHMLAAQLDIGLYHDDAARIRDAVDGLGTICAASAIAAVIDALRASPQGS